MDKSNNQFEANHKISFDELRLSVVEDPTPYDPSKTITVSNQEQFHKMLTFDEDGNLLIKNIT